MKKVSFSSHPVKHIPQRTCVACRQVKAKRELVRFVHTSDKGVEVDLSGRKVGRGAYLCQARECWETGLRGGRLEHSLKTTIAQDDREKLIIFREDFLREPEEVSGKDK